MASGRTVLAILTIILCLLLGVVVPIGCFIAGAKYDGQCPIQPYITVYLYVSGAFCFLKGLINIIAACIFPRCGESPLPRICMVMDAVVGIFLLAWFTTGSIWVYRIYGTFSSDPEDAPNYCNPDYYNYAFGILTAQWILAFLSWILTVLAQCCKQEE